MRYDVIVVGLGAVGSATLYQLSRHSACVMGIDRFSPPHDRGSSHGDTRITRLAIGEGAAYTPLARRSHQIWRELEGKTNETLLTQCGGMVISSADSKASMHVDEFYANTVDAARRHGIAHDVFDFGQIRERFPQFRIRENEFAYFERDAGFVRPERCVNVQLGLAEKQGAEIHRNETVVECLSSKTGVAVRTQRDEYLADQVIVAAGPWIPILLGPPVDRLLKVYRQALFWFAEHDRSAFSPERFPVFMWELPDKPMAIYGFPDVDGAGFKIATERYETAILPDDLSREVHSSEVASMYASYVEPYFSGVSRTCIRSVACMYTVTPDAGFIIDRLPAASRIILASCCSGHGFKHSAAIGEVLADLARGTHQAFDLKPFALTRFS